MPVASAKAGRPFISVNTSTLLAALRYSSLFFVPLSCGVDVRSMPLGFVHLIPRQILLSEIYSHTAQSPSFRTSSSPLPLNHSHCLPSYITPLYPHHIPQTITTSFRGRLSVISPPPFCCFSGSLISYPFKLCYSAHKSSNSVTSNFFSYAFFATHVSAPYVSAGISTVLNTFSLDLHVHSSVTQQSR